MIKFVGTDALNNGLFSSHQISGDLYWPISSDYRLRKRNLICKRCTMRSANYDPRNILCSPVSGEVQVQNY